MPLICATPALALDAVRAEVGSVHLNLVAHRRGLFAVPSHALVQKVQIAVDRVVAYPGQVGDLKGVQIQRKQAYNSAELALRNARTENIAIFH